MGKDDRRKNPMLECWLVHPIDDDDCLNCPSVKDCREVREYVERLVRDLGRVKAEIQALKECKYICSECGADICQYCGHCSTEHNEDPVDNCPKKPLHKGIIPKEKTDGRQKQNRMDKVD